MAKLTTYQADTRFASGDILIKDGTNGTRKISASDAAVEFAGLVSAVNHRNIYRGKSLGTSVTAAQKAAIANGTFDDLFIGDYWTIGSIKYRIADMDYWLNCGDTSTTKHHLVMIPDQSLYSAVMNNTNTTDGGYVGSKMYTTNLAQAKTTISTAFGDMLLTHREYLTNAVTAGAPSGGAWFDSTVELMNEPMVYGSHFFASANNGVTVPTRYTINNSQLSIFRLNPTMIKNRETIWLRDVVSAASFAIVYYLGYAAYNGASASNGVRPDFAIVGN